MDTSSDDEYHEFQDVSEHRLVRTASALAREQALRVQAEGAVLDRAAEADDLEGELFRTHTAIDRELARANSDGSWASAVSHMHGGSQEADQGAELVRTRTSHGPEYDDMLERGIPRRMLRKAWIVTSGNAKRCMDYVRSNFDQPASFWLTASDGGTLSEPEPASSGGDSVQPLLARIAQAVSESGDAAALAATLGLSTADLAALRAIKKTPQPAAKATFAAPEGGDDEVRPRIPLPLGSLLGCH